MLKLDIFLCAYHYSLTFNFRKSNIFILPPLSPTNKVFSSNIDYLNVVIAYDLKLWPNTYFVTRISNSFMSELKPPQYIKF